MGGTSAPPHCVGFVLLIRPHASRIQESKSSQPALLIPHTAAAAGCDKLFSVLGGLKTLSIHNTVHSACPSFPNLHSPLLLLHLISHFPLSMQQSTFLSMCILQSGSEKSHSLLLDQGQTTHPPQFQIEETELSQHRVGAIYILIFVSLSSHFGLWKHHSPPLWLSCYSRIEWCNEAHWKFAG